MTKEEYFNLDAVNCSLISALATHPQAAKRILDGEKKTSPGLNFGSLVDCLVFTLDEFTKEFYVGKFSRPADKLGELIDAYINIKENIFKNDYDVTGPNEIILAAREKTQYQMNWKNDTIIEKVKPLIDSYLLDLSDANSRTIIENEQLEKAQNVVETLKTNEFTKGIFNSHPNPNDIEIITQHVLIFFENGIDFKCMLDRFFIHKSTNSIFPYDLKTYTESFKSNYYKYKYYYQAALYSHALKVTYPQYKICPFRFIAADSDNIKPPIIYEVPQKHINIAEFGGRFNDGYYRPGWRQLAENLIWHKNNNKWDYTYEQYNNNGIEILE